MKSAIDHLTMRESDLAEINNGTGGLELMRRAAVALSEALKDVEGRVAIVCGKGNNGGDGYALSTILASEGRDHTLFNLEPPKTDEAKYYYDLCDPQRIAKLCDDVDFGAYDVIVDCVFGNGFGGAVGEPWRGIFARINAADAYVIACDLPSGLDADSGKSDGGIVADRTVAIGCCKQGMFLSDGLDVCGDIVVADIGIPLVRQPIEVYDSLSDVKGFFPEPKSNIDKWSRGTTALLGSSRHFFGALLLAEQGVTALRMGAGLNRLLVPESLVSDFRVRITESTLTPIPDLSGEMVFDPEILDAALRGVSSLGIGCGWGRGQANRDILRYILQNYKGRLVIDADGLFFLKDLADEVRASDADIVLTPHINEFARLTDMDREEIGRDRVAAAKGLARSLNVVVLLKGNGTIVTDGERVSISTVGSPAQAKAGSGDMLLGAITALLSRGLSAMSAALGACVVIGSAARLALSTNNVYSLLPSDTVQRIPEILNRIMYE